MKEDKELVSSESQRLPQRLLGEVKMLLQNLEPFRNFNQLSVGKREAGNSEPARDPLTCSPFEFKCRF